MRIAIDCRCVFAGCGGIGNYARQLVRALAKISDSDEFLIIRSELQPTEAIVSQSNFHHVCYPAAMLDENWEQFELPNVLEEYRIDVYHNPTFAVPIVRPCRVVATIHDVVFHYRPELVKPGLRDYLSRWAETAAHTADRVLTVSEYSRRAIAHAYGTPVGKIDVSYEAADPQRFRRLYGGAREDELRARYSIRGPFILYVGSLEPKKNIDRLLDAFAMARRDGCRDHTLVLAGGQGGMEYDASEAVWERGLEDGVIVTGFLPDDLLPYAYNAADFFVYPSLYEGFGLPPLEAMSCGTPVVVSNVTSLPEVVGEAGLLVDPGDTGALAEALSRLATNCDLRRDLGAEGARRAETFSWQRAALETMQCYRLALGDGGLTVLG